MLLMLIEKQYRLDEVIFYDTKMEFQAIYDIENIVKNILLQHEIKYTRLEPDVPFIDKMLNIDVKKRDGSVQRGYGMCGGKCRWGTTDKYRTIEKYLKSQYGEDYREYIGIASDETERIKKECNKHKLLPLVEWNMTEKDCLDYCYRKGFKWLEDEIMLYEVFDRVSCWCCANKNKKELENMRKYLPHYYLRRIELLKQIKKNNKRNSVVVKNAKEQFIKMF